jgi:hypothetical protein
VVSPASSFEYFFGDETLVASVAVKAVDKLLQWGFAKILRSNVIHTKVCKVGQPWVLTRCRNPFLVYEHKLWANASRLTAKRACFDGVCHEMDFISRNVRGEKYRY